MTLATVAAVDALEAALSGTGVLPAWRRNDLALAGFVDTATPGVKWLCAIADDDWDNPDTVLGGGNYELSVGAEILFAVEGEAGAARNTVFNTGVEAIRDVLFPGPGRLPLAIPGAFEDLHLAGAVERHRFGADTGALPVEAIRFRLSLLITAPTPFG